jgi:predicted Zn-dependent protease
LDSRGAFRYKGDQMVDRSLTLAVALLTAPSPNPVSDFNSGMDAERRGDLSAAAAWLDRAQRTAPRWALAKLELAEVLLAEGGAPDRVMGLLAEAQALESQNPRLYHLRALALLEKGDPALAEVSERAALSLRPEFPEARQTLGEALWRGGKREEAFQIWRDLSSRHPKDTAVRALLIDRLLDDGRGPEAEAELRILVAAEPKNAIWHRRLARTLGAEGRGIEAASERGKAEALAGETAPKRKLRRLPDSKR